MSLPPALRERLRDAELMRDLDLGTREALFATGQRRSAPRRTILFSPGDPATTLFLVVDGTVKLLQPGGDGHESTLRVVGPGELLGGVAILPGALYPSRAEVESDADLVVWEEPVLRRLILDRPVLPAAVLRVVTARMRDLHNRLRELATERVAQQVARTLLRLARQAGRSTPEGILLDLPLSRQDLAEMSGTTLYTVSRLLAGWQDLGLVDAGRERVVIRAPHGLVRIAEDSDRS